jgi:hypothetical protein
MPAVHLLTLLLALSCGALLACSPRQTTAPTRDEAAVPAASAAPAAAPAPVPAPAPAPEAPAPLATPASAPAGECATVDDCATTRFEDGACCAMLCSPRATTKKAVQEAAKVRCNTLVKCAQPFCQPPRFQQRLACEAGKCVMQMVGRVEQER